MKLNKIHATHDFNAKMKTNNSYALLFPFLTWTANTDLLPVIPVEPTDRPPPLILPLKFDRKINGCYHGSVDHPCAHCAHHNAEYQF